MMTLIDRCRDLSIKQVHFGATNDLLPKLRLVLEVEIDPLLNVGQRKHLINGQIPAEFEIWNCRKRPSPVRESMRKLSKVHPVGWRTSEMLNWAESALSTADIKSSRTRLNASRPP